MELTAQNLQEVTFGAKVRGYDPAEVDDFIAVVAEGVEELRERLRRVTERATRAEQQLAERGGAPAAAVAPVTTTNPAASTSVDFSQVLARAVAAAEAALAEAQADAERLMAETRSEVGRQLAEAHEQAETERSTAHQEAETVLGQARAEADTVVTQARDEAARLANESQGQLRAEITQLEEARNQLKHSVDELSTYLESELSRARKALSDAMNGIDSRAVGSATPPEVGEVEVPPVPEYMTFQHGSQPAQSGSDSEEAKHDANQAPESDDWTGNSSSDDWGSNTAGEDNGANSTPADWNTTAEAAEPAPASADKDQGGDGAAGAGQGPQSRGVHSSASIAWDDDPASEPTGHSEEPEADAASSSEWSSTGASNDWGVPADKSDWGQPAQNSWGSTQNGWGQSNGTDDESDPFLAELRRAVRDEEPLGPRSSGDEAINSLYSDDAPDTDEGDDKNGFFRRKK